MPRTARRETPTDAETAAAAAAGLVIDTPPTTEGKGKRSPVVWYWSVRGWNRSWLGSWVPHTRWWWTYTRLPGHDFRGQSESFEDVLAVFKAARKAWLEKRT